MELKRKIVLASASPRRKELLEKIGLTFTVDPSNFPEEMSIRSNGHNGSDSSPEILVQSLSISKARVIGNKHPDALIIAADTIGVLRGKIIGKPQTPEEARSMLRAMSGKSHRVITGFTVLDTSSQKIVTRTEETRVYFKELSPEEINDYVETGEPLDKAGAYAIQGLGSLFITKIVGDYYNVMGLPLYALSQTLKEFGVRVL